ncbi:alpha/beta hydrolase family protein [Flavobacteriaceae bacterium M23B6Z8]
MQKQKNIILNRSNNKPLVLDIFYDQSPHKLPVVIFCHGYKGFKDWGAWDLVAQAFADHGFFFLKFNFSHNGGTVEDPVDFPDLDAFGNNNYSKELEDLTAIISYCRDHHDTIADLSRINLIGHSRGGGIATLFSNENATVKKLISWAGVSDFAIRFPKEEAFEEWKNKGIFYVLNGRTKQKMPHYFQFWEDYAKNPERFHIENACKQISIPHLIIHGTNDTSVPLWEAEHLHKWNPESTLQLIEDANHVFGASHPWESDYIPKHLEEVVTKTISFCKEN